MRILAAPMIPQGENSWMTREAASVFTQVNRGGGAGGSGKAECVRIVVMKVQAGVPRDVKTRLLENQKGCGALKICPRITCAPPARQINFVSLSRTGSTTCT